MFSISLLCWFNHYFWLDLSILAPSIIFIRNLLKSMDLNFLSIYIYYLWCFLMVLGIALIRVRYIYFFLNPKKDIKLIEIVHTCRYRQRNLKYLLPSILTMLSSTCNFYCNICTCNFVNGFNLKYCLKCVFTIFCHLIISIWTSLLDLYFHFQLHLYIFHETSLILIAGCIVICSCWCCKYTCTNFVNFSPKLSFSFTTKYIY